MSEFNKRMAMSAAVAALTLDRPTSQVADMSSLRRERTTINIDESKYQTPYDAEAAD